MYSAVAAASLKANPADYWEWVGKSLSWLQSTASVTILLATVVMAALQFVRQTLGKPYVWEVVHALLDEMQEYVFRKQSNDPRHYHRVTLFKYIRRPGGAGRLIPVERSHHTTRKTKVKFRAPDDADHAEGVAGKTWATRQIVTVAKLPDLHSNPTDNDKRTYAASTCVTEEWLDVHKPHARSYCGIPVEIKGKPWGVIILDSRNPDAITNRVSGLYRAFGQVLAKLLERA